MRERKADISRHWFVAVAALIVAIVVMGGVVMAGQTVKKGDVVKVHYVGTLDDGTLFDTSVEQAAREGGAFDERRDYEPLEFEVGAGQMIEGFDKAVTGMKAGQTKTVKLSPAEAYGEIQDERIATLPIEKITGGSELKEGDVLSASNGMRGVVKKIENGDATVDFNHPLAGKTLNFKITLVSLV